MPKLPRISSREAIRALEQLARPRSSLKLQRKNVRSENVELKRCTKRNAKINYLHFVARGDRNDYSRPHSV